MTLRKIILAEDDIDDQQLFHDFLHQRSDAILMPVAENGEVLMNTLNGIASDDDLPNLIILDQNMPKRNGLQTLQILKADDRYEHIPVMIYSTYTDQKLINDCYNSGASMVRSKPISKEGYNKMLDEFIEKASTNES